MNNLEFYTIVTTVDIVAQPRAVEYLLGTVSIRAQPVFIGQARADGDRFVLKFAIDRAAAWDCSPSLKETILMNSSEFGFNDENLSVHKAEYV